MANRSKSPHVGSSLSCIDILAYLYFEALQFDPSDPNWTCRDYFILSKGHGAMALYAVLAATGIIRKELLSGYMQNDGTLPAHLDRFSVPGIEMSAGALGHGLSVGLGIAHGYRLKKKNNRVFVLMGDGEIQEGSVWEAAMMAPRTDADNLVAMVDCNKLQGYGRPSEIMCVEPMLEKWRAFGWYAVEADGHDFNAIHQAVNSATLSEQPAVILFKTIKGKGVSFMEDQLKWHYFIVTDEILEQAMKELAHA